MKEVPNNVLIIALVLVIFGSLLGTVLNMGLVRNGLFRPKITGKLAEGSVEMRILGLVNIAVTSSEIDFGSGAINGTTDLSTEQVNPGTFNPCIEVNGTYNSPGECRGIQIENIGNVAVILEMTSDQDGNSLFLGDNSTDEFRFAVAEGNLSRNYSNSCHINGGTGEGLYPGNTSYLTGFMNWTPVIRNFNYTICQNFSSDSSANSLVLEVNVTVPADEGSYSPGQVRTATLLFTAESV
jgi:hypothetical protein